MENKYTPPGAGGVIHSLSFKRKETLKYIKNTCKRLLVLVVC